MQPDINNLAVACLDAATPRRSRVAHAGVELIGGIIFSPRTGPIWKWDHGVPSERWRVLHSSRVPRKSG